MVARDPARGKLFGGRALTNCTADYADHADGNRGVIHGIAKSAALLSDDNGLAAPSPTQ
jgi:hypothetical protein